MIEVFSVWIKLCNDEICLSYIDILLSFCDNKVLPANSFCTLIYSILLTMISYLFWFSFRISVKYAISFSSNHRVELWSIYLYLIPSIITCLKISCSFLFYCSILDSSCRVELWISLMNICNFGLSLLHIHFTKIFLFLLNFLS
jgi:hypothetical protein